MTDYPAEWDRITLAENRFTPADTLTELASDPVAEVRAAVAANPDTPPDTLADLCADWTALVRLAAFNNDYTPLYASSNIAYDDGCSHHLSGDELDAFEDRSEWIRKVLNELRGDTHFGAFVRYGVGSPFVLGALADGEVAMRKHSAAHINTWPSTLRRLALDEDPDVARVARANPWCPPLDDVPNTLRRYSTGNQREQEIAVHHPDTPPDAFLALAGSPHWEVRLAVTQNPRAPDEAQVMAELAGTNPPPGE